LCVSLGKRLCTETEWNFACEGEEMRPYPYGFTRAPKCNQDRDDLYEVNPHRQILADRRERADARPECVSPFGVYNMAGNMDESVLREGKEHVDPFRNALKGGWWMAARNRCRPATTAHDDYYKDIQVGVRCCSGASESLP
jgi:formylglycine-generating enzyme